MCTINKHICIKFYFFNLEYMYLCIYTTKKHCIINTRFEILDFFIYAEEIFIFLL